MPRARLQALQSEFQLLILIYPFKTARKPVFQVPPPRSKDAASNWPFQSQCLPVSRVTRQQPFNEDYVIIQIISWHKIKTTEYLVIDMQSFFKEKLMTIWYCSCRISIIVFSSQIFISRPPLQYAFHFRTKVHPQDKSSIFAPTIRMQSSSLNVRPLLAVVGVLRAVLTSAQCPITPVLPKDNTQGTH